MIVNIKRIVKSKGGLFVSGLFLLFFILILIYGCKPKAVDTRPLILTSIYPYQILVQELVGDSIAVKSIIPANASPHTFSAKPADLKALDTAELLIINGLGLEAELSQAFKERSAKLIDISELFDFKQDTEPIPSHDHQGLDPHIWLSPRIMLRATLLLSDQLQTKFPTSAQTIGQNAMRLMADLTALHQDITNERAAVANPILITYHDSFHWFCKDYDISVAATVQSSPGQEPSPKQLTQLGTLIQANQIRAIFVEPQMDKRSAKVLADEFKLNILELDPLGHSFNSARITDLIWTNWQVMRQSWQPQP